MVWWDISSSSGDVTRTSWAKSLCHFFSMESSLPCSDLSKASNKKIPQRLFASAPKRFSQYAHKNIASLGHASTWNRAAGNMTLFLVKVAALEILRRFSMAKCPVVWRGFQSLQFLCYPPFKWIERWAPFRCLVKSLQVCIYHLNNN